MRAGTSPDGRTITLFDGAFKAGVERTLTHEGIHTTQEGRQLRDDFNRIRDVGMAVDRRMEERTFNRAHTPEFDGAADDLLER